MAVTLPLTMYLPTDVLRVFLIIIIIIIIIIIYLFIYLKWSNKKFLLLHIFSSKEATVCYEYILWDPHTLFFRPAQFSTSITVITIVSSLNLCQITCRYNINC